MSFCIIRLDFIGYTGKAYRYILVKYGSTRECVFALFFPLIATSKLSIQFSPVIKIIFTYFGKHECTVICIYVFRIYIYIF